MFSGDVQTACQVSALLPAAYWKSFPKLKRKVDEVTGDWT